MIWDRLFDLHLFYSVSTHVYIAYASLRHLCCGKKVGQSFSLVKGVQISFSMEEQSISIIFQTNKKILNPKPSSDYRSHICNNITYEAAASELLNVSPLSNCNEDYKVN